MPVTTLHPTINQAQTSRPEITNSQKKMISGRNQFMTASGNSKTPLDDPSKLPITNTLKEWSKHHLLTLRKSIESNCSGNSKFRQELKMQKENSHRILSQIKSSMIETQQSGIDLISKYEEQKCKHDHLIKLVKHYQSWIESEKEAEHQKIMQKIEINEYDQLSLELQQKQKLLENITDRLNASHCEKMSKYDIVKAERRERTVFSNQFNKFENQLFSLSQKYKQFVIQRFFLEKQFEQRKGEFLKVQNQWKKQIQLIDRENKDSNININIKRQNEAIEDDFSSELIIEPSFIKTKSRLNYMKMEKTEMVSKNQLSQLNQKKLLNLQYKKKLQLLMNDLGINHASELSGLKKNYPTNLNEKDNNCNDLSHSEYFQAVELTNEQRHQDLEKLEDTISEWEIKINQLKKVIKSTCQPKKMSRQQKLKLKTLKQTKLLISSLAQNYHSTNQEIAGFYSSQNLSILFKLFNLDPKSLFFELGISPHSNQLEPLQIDLNKLSQVEQKLFSLMSKVNFQNLKMKARKVNIRKSFFFESILTHPQQKDSLINTQRTICPLLEPIKPQSKRIWTVISQNMECQPLKKLSSLLRNQYRLKGPTDIASKDQMIKEATQAFGKEGIIRPEKFQVRYS